MTLIAFIDFFELISYWFYFLKFKFAINVYISFLIQNDITFVHLFEFWFILILLP